MTGRANLDSCLQSAITEAELALQAAAGSQSVCELHKSGRVTGGVKYQEGRLVALHALRRALRVLARDEGQAAGPVLQAELARWQDLLHDHQSAALPSMPWIAYAQGGVDVCSAILERQDPMQQAIGEIGPAGTK